MRGRLCDKESSLVIILGKECDAMRLAISLAAPDVEPGEIMIL